MKTEEELIAEEGRRQIEEKGWMVKHDKFGGIELTMREFAMVVHVFELFKDFIGEYKFVINPDDFDMVNPNN